jgi:hypothetical protein
MRKWQSQRVPLWRGCVRSHAFTLSTRAHSLEAAGQRTLTMNGVRRFLNGNEPPRDTSPSQSPPRLAPLQAVAPLTIPLKGPSWPPPSPSAAVPQSPPAEVTKTTAALFLRKDKQRPVPVPSTDEGHGQPGAPAASASTGHIARSSTNPLSTSGLQYLGATGSKRVISSSELSATNGGGANARDQLFISLLSSEAVVDSREYHVLQAEEVEELKKVRVHTLFRANLAQHICPRKSRPCRTN